MENELSVGDIAPDFSIPSVNDGTFTLADAVRGSNVLLYFYVVNYGKTCTDYIEMMNDRSKEFDGLGITMVHINPDSVENHMQWMQRTGSRYDHLSDIGQTVSREYGAIVERAKTDKILGYTNREFFLIDREMRIRYIWRAHWPNDTVPMSQLIRELKAALGNE